ncbi:MAG: ribonuclease HIII [Kiritimatiellia bacterium]
MATSYTYELTNDQQEILLGIMVNGNYRRREVPYSLWSIEGDHFNATLYAKETHGRRKLCVQGSKAEDFVLFVLEPNVLGGATLGYETVLHPERVSAHGGSDESGKGDYFGPLVVCCAYVDEAVVKAIDGFTYFNQQDRRVKLEVRDCKQMSDRQVLEAGRQLRALLGPSGYAVVKLGPAAYNRLYAKIGNVNRLLAWAHGTAIEELLEKRPDVNRVVVDQFAPTETTIRRALKSRGKAATVEQRHKAESDVAVAVASVIARELFLRAIMDMTREVFGEGDGQKVPAGSSDPRVRALAEEMVRANGPVWLMNHCKAHFQTTDKVLAACGKSRADLPPEGRVVSSVANSSFKSKDRKSE